jgi:hypothetical protein
MNPLKVKMMVYLQEKQLKMMNFMPKQLDKWLELVPAIAIFSILMIATGCGMKKQKANMEKKAINKEIATGLIYKKLTETLNTFSSGSTGVLKADADEFLGSIEKDYTNYRVEGKYLDSLMDFLNGGMVYIDVYGGNWCSDTRYGMGGLTRVLDACKMPAGCFRYIRVSKEKKLIDIHVEGIEISKVPLVIVHNQKKEFGRIIEVPEKGQWEFHLLKIMEKALN